jgi:hypothetical protein
MSIRPSSSVERRRWGHGRSGVGEMGATAWGEMVAAARGGDGGYDSLSSVLLLLAAGALVLAAGAAPPTAGAVVLAIAALAQVLLLPSTPVELIPITGPPPPVELIPIVGPPPPRAAGLAPLLHRLSSSPPVLSPPLPRIAPSILRRR